MMLLLAIRVYCIVSLQELLQERHDMRYIRKVGGNLFFQRDYPQKLKQTIGAKQYNKALGSASQTEAQLLKARSEALATYDAKVKLAEVSDPEAFSEVEMDRLVNDLLRSRGSRQGAYADVVVDPSITERENRERKQLQDTPAGLATDIIPEIEVIFDKNQYGEKLSAEDEVFGEAWVRLQRRAADKPKLLSGLWPDYAKYRQLAKSSTQEKIWNNWMLIIGDRLIGEPLIEKRIRDAINDYRDRRLKAVCRATVKRDLADILACLNYNSRSLNLGWYFKLPILPRVDAVPSTRRSRESLTPEQQMKFIKHCTSTDTRDGLGVVALLYLQAGMMFSEIERLDADEQLLGLASYIPHLTITGMTKTDARKRVVPIVLEIDFIRNGLVAAVKFCRDTSAGHRSRALKLLLIEATGSDHFTGHCLRHTLRLNCHINGVRDSDTCALGGWASVGRSFSKVMLTYGAAGLAGSESLKALQQASRLAHRHLLK